KTNIPLYIPGKVKRVELKPIKFVDNNLITRHNGLEELIFAEGTEEINDYAIENCPKLRTIWIPATLKQRGEKAFDGCHPSLVVKTGKP
ncbi:leucine-rich repeat protein, partial [Bacteroides pyogenes]|uniref:leucine-rich repeat protein n=1 Tax=Bacteroides pyogenes TaxID=310300 RepID=UPI002A9157D9